MKSKIEVVEKTQELYERISRVETLSEIYNYLVDKMNWDVLKYNSADEEHENDWFSEFEEDDGYCYEIMQKKLPVYEEVLNLIEKLMK